MNRRTFDATAAAATAAIGVGGGGALSRAGAESADTQDGVDAAARSRGGGDGSHHHHVVVDEGYVYPEGSRAYAEALGGVRPHVTRKSASTMSRAEVDRFTRAFTWAVARGYLDVFNDEHFDHMRNRQHGADVLAGAPPAVAPGLAASWGHRLLPWHRSFLLEAEQMLQAALYERNQVQGRDPDEAKLVFLPYWDASHDRRLPTWVERLQPKGGTAIVPEDLPEGHAAFGLEVGTRYRIQFNRWPGGFLTVPELPPVAQIQRVLAHDAWADFYNAIDNLPELVTENGPAAKQALGALAQLIPDDPNLQILLQAATDPNYFKGPNAAQAALEAFNAFLAVGHIAYLEDAKRDPDENLMDLILALFSVFRFPPHLVFHFWTGGLDPRNPNVRGTVSYFNELVVDPAFWMLHGELDHIWYTWQETHTELPPLQGDDTIFDPLRPEEGAWYGGGRVWTLSELADRDSLSYGFDRLYTP
jgi:hypothetical protein